MTQEELAREASIARTTYSSIEQGRRNPSVKNAMRIAEILNFEWTIFLAINYANRLDINRRWDDGREIITRNIIRN